MKGRKVLAVDDDMRNLFALTDELEDFGMVVVKATNGREALDVLAKETDIDIVLMDIMMPVMDGYTAMQNIRKQPGLRDLPILALTAKAMREDRNKCIEAGANDYIPKPVDIDRLLSTMRVWLK
jgi:CheY-like chemotaxis protein